MSTAENEALEQERERVEKIRREKTGHRAQNRQLLQQLQQQKSVNRRLTAVLVLLGCLLAVNLICAAGMYGRLTQLEELLTRAVVQIQAQETDRETGNYRQAAEYQASAEERTGETVGTVQEDYPDLWGLDQVDPPVERTKRQVLEELRRLAQDGGLIEEIYGDRKNYPDRLLEALANNPEMAGFVAGYPERDEKAAAFLTESEKKKSFPLFLQWDPRWGYKEYGDGSMIAISGCGPTCVSMALYYLTRDESLTPDVIADYSMENGYYVPGVGTAWALLEDAPEGYGIDVTQPKIREENLTEVLDDGGVLVCSMSAGDFTAGGHFIVIYGYDREGFLVNDPNCVARSRRHWDWDSLQGQIKNVWAYTNRSAGTDSRAKSGETL
ncbi:MAG: C39 family peptidase [bacterium]|nr:C39 family peptidase [bacterium]